MNEHPKYKVAIIGLGIIGTRCADKLISAGIDVTTWNRTKKDRPDSTDTAIAATANAQVIAFYLKDSLACKAVFQDIRKTLLPGKILINHSTIDLETTQWLEKQCKSIGCGFLDCPFTGSKIAAQNGELVYYAGGDDNLIKQYRNILEITSKEIIPVGKAGNATVIKVATNLISASTVQALSESLAIAKANNIPTESFIAAVSGNACGSALAAMKLPTMASGEYDTHFSLDNMLKDANYAIQLAKSAELKTPGIQTTANVMKQLCEKGAEQLDYSALFKQFEN